ncbi:MAG: GNAT family N-acetyltransferase [Dehalococcoidales bacterium]
MMLGGTSRVEMMDMLVKFGYTKKQADKFLLSYNYQEKSSNIDRITKNKIGFEYLDKHTADANKATEIYKGVPSEIRDAIGHAARSSTLFNNSNVMVPQLKGFDPNSLHTNDAVFKDMARKLKQLTGFNLPSSAVARDSRVMSSLMRAQGKLGKASGGMIPKFQMGSQFDFKHFQLGKNSKFIKDLYSKSFNSMSSSSGNYQLFRAVEDKQLDAKHYGLIAAIEKASGRPASALSYYNDGKNFGMPNLGTDPGFGGKGLATKLMAQLISHGKTSGMKGMYWDSLPGADTYYKKLGASHRGNGRYSLNFNNLDNTVFKQNGGQMKKYFAGGLEALASPELLMGAFGGIQSGLGIMGGIGGGALAIDLIKRFQQNKFFERFGSGDLTSDGVKRFQKLMNLKQFQGESNDAYGNVVQNNPFMDANIGRLSQQFNKNSWLTNLKRRFGRASGGKIQGRGTSISDSIGANLSPGSYILDRDTVQALGENFLNKVTGNSTYKGLASGGYGSPNAMISNGEWLLNPSQSASLGGPKILDQLRGMSNDRVLSPKERSRLPFASGGNIPGFKDGSEFSINDLKRPITNENSVIDMLTRSDIKDAVQKADPGTTRLSYNQMFGKSTLTPGSNNLPSRGNTRTSYAEPTDMGNMGKSDLTRFILNSFSENKLKNVDPTKSAHEIATTLSDSLSKQFKKGITVNKIADMKIGKQLEGSLRGREPGFLQDPFKYIGFIEKELKPFATNIATSGKIPSGPSTTKYTNNVNQVTDILDNIRPDLIDFNKRIETSNKSLAELNRKYQEATKYNKLPDISGIDANYNPSKSDLNRRKQLADELSGKNKQYENLPNITTFERRISKKSGGPYDVIPDISGIDANYNPSEADLANRKLIDLELEQETAKRKQEEKERKEKLAALVEVRNNKIARDKNRSNALRDYNDVDLQYNTRHDDELGSIRKYNTGLLAKPYDVRNQDNNVQGIGNKFNALMNRGGSKFSEIYNRAQNVGYEKTRVTTGQVLGSPFNLTKGISWKELREDYAGSIKKARDTSGKMFTDVVGGIEEQMKDFTANKLGNRLGGNVAREMVKVSPQLERDSKSGEITGTLTYSLELLTERLKKTGMDAKDAEGFIGEFDKKLEELSGNRTVKSTTLDSRKTTEPEKFGVLANTSKWSKDLSWRAASLSMSSMGVYFSLMGIFMALSSAVTSLTGSLSDLNTVFKNVGYVNAFSGSANKANEIMGKFGVTQKDLVKGWENVTYAQSAFGLSMSSLAASIFKDKNFTDGLVDSIGSLFTKLAEKDTMEGFTKFLTAGAKALPEVVDALKWVTSGLTLVGDHPGLIKIAAQMYGITLLLQPLTSGVSLFLSGFGQAAGAVKALKQVNMAVDALNLGMNGIALKAGLAVIALEAVGQAYQWISGQEAPWWLKPISSAGAVLSGVNPITQEKMFAEGGAIGGPNTAAIDDKTVRVEEGEYVINKRSASKLGKNTLDQLNKFATGGSIGLLQNSSGMSVSGYAINKSDTDTFGFKIYNKTDENATASKSSAKVLVAAAESDGIGVYIRNWKDGWQNGNDEKGGMPFDMGLPQRWIYGFLGNPNGMTGNGMGVNPNPSPSPEDNLNEESFWRPDENVNPNPQVNENPNPNANPNPSTLPSSYTGAVANLLQTAFESFKQTVGAAIDSIAHSAMESLKALMNGAETAGNVIKDLGLALLTLDNGKVVEMLQKGAGAVKGAATTVGGNLASAYGGRSLGGILNSDSLAQHAYYRAPGDVKDYGPTGVRNAGFWDKFVNGKYEYPEMPSKQSPSIVDRLFNKGKFSATSPVKGKDQLTGKEIGVLDVVDLLSVGTNVNQNRDPYSAALELNNQIAMNALTGGGERVMEQGSRVLPAMISRVVGSGPARNTAASWAGKAVGGVGATTLDLMKLAGAPEAVVLSGLAEGGIANENFMNGVPLDEITQGTGKGKYNNASGIFTSNLIQSGYGRGMGVWGKRFGLNEEQMRDTLNQNKGLMDFSVMPGFVAQQAVKGLGMSDQYNGFWNKLKGGNTAVSDMIRGTNVSLPTPLGNLEVSGGIADLNSSIYDLIGSLANLDVGSIFGAGTGLIGTGESLGVMGGKLAEEVTQDPAALLSLAMTGIVPVIGPALANMLLPETTAKISTGVNEDDITQPATLQSLNDGMITTAKGFSIVNGELDAVSNEGLPAFYNKLMTGSETYNVNPENNSGNYSFVSKTNENEFTSIQLVKTAETLKQEQIISQSTTQPQKVEISVNVQGDDSNVIASKVKTDLVAMIEQIVRSILPTTQPTTSRL